MFLLLACIQAEPEATNVATEIEEEGESDFAFVHPLTPPANVQIPQSDCEDQEYGDGLTLITVPRNTDILVIAVDEFGTVLYQETVRSNDCGVATPFTQVDPEQFGDMWNDWAWGVYAQVRGDSNYYVFQGVFLEENVADIPISTQWYWEEEVDDWVAISDPGLGIMIGIFMIP